MGLLQGLFGGGVFQTGKFGPDRLRLLSLMIVNAHTSPRHETKKPAAPMRDGRVRGMTVHAGFGAGGVVPPSSVAGLARLGPRSTQLARSRRGVSRIGTRGYAARPQSQPGFPQDRRRHANPRRSELSENGADRLAGAMDRAESPGAAPHRADTRFPAKIRPSTPDSQVRNTILQ